MFEGNENMTFFINRDATGFYVFSMDQGLNPIAKWVRRDRQSEGSAHFNPSYTADITYAGDRVNGYKFEHGLYADMGTSTHQAEVAVSAAVQAVASSSSSTWHMANDNCTTREIEGERERERETQREKLPVFISSCGDMQQVGSYDQCTAV